MIGIIGAMDTEINELKVSIKEMKTEIISNIEFYSGKINNKDVVVAKCGIGKVFAAVCTEAMILNYHPEKIIHIGIAGALSNELGVKDVAIANSVVQYDVDQTAFDMPLGFIQGPDIVNIPCDKKIVAQIENSAKNLNINYKTGVIASGDKFISNNMDKEKIIKNFGAIAVDMEGAATGQVCYVNDVDFCVVRAMSDGGDDDAIDTYNKSKQLSSDVATKILIEYLNNY